MNDLFISCLFIFDQIHVSISAEVIEGNGIIDACGTDTPRSNGRVSLSSSEFSFNGSVCAGTYLSNNVLSTSNGAEDYPSVVPYSDETIQISSLDFGTNNGSKLINFANLEVKENTVADVQLDNYGKIVFLGDLQLQTVCVIPYISIVVC